MDIDEAFAQLTKAVEALPPAEFERYQAVNQPAIFGHTESGVLISLN